MQPNPTPTPDFAHRLATILAGLAALIARHFARHPFHAPFIAPLCRHITHAARHLNRTFARLAAGRAPRPGAPASASPDAAGPHLQPVLPTGRAWLVHALGSEAVTYASELAFLLAEPEVADALARSAAARRTLAPIRRMLGITPPRPRQPRRRLPAPPPPSPAPTISLHAPAQKC